jgi:hypothetical protein
MKTEEMQQTSPRASHSPKIVPRGTILVWNKIRAQHQPQRQTRVTPTLQRFANS